MPESRPLFDDRRPELFPAYRRAGVCRLATSDGPIVIGLSNVGLDIHLFDGQVLHYDLEGRLLRLATPNVQWRLGLSGRMLRLSKRPAGQGGGFERRRVPAAECRVLIDQCAERMRQIYQLVQDVDSGRVSQHPRDQRDLLSATERAAAFDAAQAECQTRRFREVYHNVPILPPDQYASLVLLATEGCRYNQCTFCGLYRQAPFRNKSIGEFRQHVSDATAFVGRGRARQRGIFLGQANALMGPRPWRESILREINDVFRLPEPALDHSAPGWWKGSVQRFSEITSFLDGFVGVRMEAEEFRALRQLNLRRIFIGMESGDQRLLDWLRKPSTPEQMEQTVRAARAGDVRSSIIVLIGAGGENFFEQHVDETIRWIRAMQLGPGDGVYLSPLVPAEHTEYAERAEADGIVPLAPQRMVEQERRIRAGVRSAEGQRGPYVAHYEVAHFLF